MGKIFFKHQRPFVILYSTKMTIPIRSLAYEPILSARGCSSSSKSKPPTKIVRSIPLGSWSRVQTNRPRLRLSNDCPLNKPNRPGIVGPLDAVLNSLQSPRRTSDGVRSSDDRSARGDARAQITAAASPTRQNGVRTASAQLRASRRLHDGSSTVRKQSLNQGLDETERPSSRPSGPSRQSGEVPPSSLMRQLNQSGTWIEDDPYDFGGGANRNCLCEELNESFAWLESDGEPLTSEEEPDNTMEVMNTCYDDTIIRRTASF